jgi:D-serine dehydratase
MPAADSIPADLLASLAQKQPVLWINEQRIRAKVLDSQVSISASDLHNATEALERFAPLLALLFPETAATGGIVESPLVPVPKLQMAMSPETRNGRWFLKADHLLPIAGSVKARGGIYEVLSFAEELALSEGLLKQTDPTTVLASTRARGLFSTYEILVGSTGNLGLSIGVIGAALGFRTTVHMSAEAKEWKKARLRERGVSVVEHDGDFGSAVSAGRHCAASNPQAYFVDDESSRRLFLGYTAAARQLKLQLDQNGIIVDDQHPLFVYLPCGVGGAPSGITFGLHHLFGVHAHCFFAEPVASPCVLIRCASTADREISVDEVGLDNRTAADGLAVGRASEFAVSMVRSIVSGAFTVKDDDLFEDLYMLKEHEGMRIEPSAAAGVRGPKWVQASHAGVRYLNTNDLTRHMDRATHILWTTGGLFVPEREYQEFYERGHGIVQSKSTGKVIS